MWWWKSLSMFAKWLITEEHKCVQTLPDTPHWPVTWDSPARSQCPRCCPWCWDSPINQKLRWRLRLESQHLHRKHKSKHIQHSLSPSHPRRTSHYRCQWPLPPQQHSRNLIKKNLIENTWKNLWENLISGRSGQFERHSINLIWYFLKMSISVNN